MELVDAVPIRKKQRSVKLNKWTAPRTAPPLSEFKVVL